MAKKDITDYLRTDRRDFGDRALDISEVAEDPHTQFAFWMADAKAEGVKDPYAVSVSTVDADGYPQCRVVYLRDIIDGGYVFYTNYSSGKGTDIAQHPKAAMNFHWAEQDRQVKLVGDISPVADEVSDAYFASRPRESQLGAWASDQSSVLADRDTLTGRLDLMRKRYEGSEVPRPPHWGGYILYPHTMEFWQGRSSRLHDRLQYRQVSGHWVIERLNP